ncbi:MAG: hypothetical protein QW780_04830 [Sulfolobales archaeon]
MGVSISIYSLQDVARTLSTLQSLAESLQSAAIHALKLVVSRSSKLVGQKDYISKDKVELAFWVHKAFVLGFVLALAITSLKG